MVANHENVKKVPASADEWITSSKAILESALTRENVLRYVKGESNAFGVVQNKRNRIIELKNKAWSLVLDFIIGTPLLSFHQSFLATQDAPGLWKKICDHFEKDNSQTRRATIQQNLQNLEVKSSLDDRQIALEELVSRIDSYVVAHNTLAGNQNQLDETAKKVYLQNALAKSRKFDDVANNVSLDDPSYTTYIAKIKQGIDFYKIREHAINKLEHKQIQEKSEQTEATSAMVAQSEEEVSDEDLKSLYAASKSNTKKLLHLLKKRNPENGENSNEMMQNQNGGGNVQYAPFPQNSQFGGRGFHQNFQSGGRGRQNYGRGRGFGGGRGRQGRFGWPYVQRVHYHPFHNQGYYGQPPHPSYPRPFPPYPMQQPPANAYFVEMPPPTLPPQMPSSFASNVSDYY